MTPESQQFKPKFSPDQYKEKMRERGWKYVEAKHIGGEKWEPGYFEMGAKV